MKNFSRENKSLVIEILISIVTFCVALSMKDYFYAEFGGLIFFIPIFAFVVIAFIPMRMYTKKHPNISRDWKFMVITLIPMAFSTIYAFLGALNWINNK